jgi:hypothetical protein
MAQQLASNASKPGTAKPRVSSSSASTATSREHTPTTAPGDSLAAGRTRARARAPAPTGSFEDALGGLESNLKLNTLEEARALLMQGQYIPSNCDNVTTSQLATTLLILLQDVSAKVGKTHAAYLRAVALMLHHEDTTCTAQLIASKVTDMQELILQKLQSATESMTHATSAMTDATGTLDQQITTLARQEEVTRESVQDLAMAVQVMNGAADELMASSTTPVEHLAQVSSQAAAATATAPGAAHPPAPAPALPTAQAHATAQAKALADERNIILDLDGEAAVGVAKLSEQELVERANVAIDRMGIQAGDKPTQFAFAAAYKLEHGGIRYRMVDKASADWLRRPDIRVAFAEAYGGDGRLKDRTYAVIAEFADVAFNPVDPDGLRATARLNAIPESIASARWLKRANRRRPNQRKAFLEIMLTSPKAANTLIRAGCVINGCTLRTRKRLTEPKRCMKCNRFTTRHTAKTCKADHDTCTKCSGNHREDVCTSDTLACVNCKGDHAASDRACPRYLEELAKIRDRVPDNKYPYYPEADDPSTWVQDSNSPPSSQQVPGAAAPTTSTDGWRTVVTRKRGRRPGATATKSGTAPSKSPHSAAASDDQRPRSRSSTRTATGVVDGPPTRPATPLRQMTLHEQTSGSVLPRAPRPRANTASAATPTRSNA